MASPDILIAGIGNIFFGDDGFGVEVVRQLARCQLPAAVRVVDFGIRSYDLAFALLDGVPVTIFVDATMRGEPPGTLYLIELDENEFNNGNGEQLQVDAHTMNPRQVLKMVKAMGGQCQRMLLVGCEPATLISENDMSLSAPVAAAIAPAITMITSLVAEILTAK
jgi:hydrogenase maturation protease